MCSLLFRTCFLLFSTEEVSCSCISVNITMTNRTSTWENNELSKKLKGYFCSLGQVPLFAHHLDLRVLKGLPYSRVTKQATSPRITEIDRNS